MDKAVSHYNTKKQLLLQSQEKVTELKHAVELKEGELKAVSTHNKMLQLDVEKAQSSERKLLSRVASLEAQVSRTSHGADEKVLAAIGPTDHHVSLPPAGLCRPQPASSEQDPWKRASGNRVVLPGGSHWGRRRSRQRAGEEEPQLRQPGPELTRGLAQQHQVKHPRPSPRGACVSSHTLILRPYLNESALQWLLVELRPTVLPGGVFN